MQLRRARTKCIFMIVMTHITTLLLNHIKYTLTQTKVYIFIKKHDYQKKKKLY